VVLGAVRDVDECPFGARGLDRSCDGVWLVQVGLQAGVATATFGVLTQSWNGLVWIPHCQVYGGAALMSGSRRHAGNVACRTKDDYGVCHDGGSWLWCLETTGTNGDCARCDLVGKVKHADTCLLSYRPYGESAMLKQCSDWWLRTQEWESAMSRYPALYKSGGSCATNHDRICNT
jgi:hypothetical protein